ncbi:MAG TPA: Gfo/Idh/MocA family oxidoreductase [Herpetosiphonaceae bacterium]
MSMTLTAQRQHIALAPEPQFVEQVRIGIIGCGYWGPKLARNFQDLPGSHLAMMADLQEQRLASIKQLYPEVAVTRDYQELLAAGIDAVIIATPVKAHYHLAKAALLAGKHVLVEKPLTAWSSQARELTDLALERGLTLMVGHTFEYNPAVEAVREIVQSGELGDVYYFNSTRANLGLLQPDINVIWDLGPHDISMIRFILGVDPVKVSAVGTAFVNARRGLHEVAYVNLTFENGVVANLRLSWLSPVKRRRLTVVGSKKMLVYDDIADDKVVIYDKGIEIPPYSITEEEFHASYRHGEELVYPLTWVEPLQRECEHFLHCIRTRTTPRSDGEDGIKVIKALETAQRSLVNGGVELKIEY